MADKIKSEIVRIDLTDASYKDSHAYIEPTYVNFFFGNNGAGKSTIAKAIKSSAGLTYAPGRTASDYLPLVYNQDFIDENFRSYRNMKGVFTLNAKNAEIQKQIDEVTEKRTQVKKLLSEASDKRGKITNAKDKLHKDFLKECWERGRTLRDDFPGTMDKKGKSDPFAREILKHAPADIDMEDLRRLYESAYSETAKRYQRFTTIADPMVMDTVDGREILSKPIVNSADTELAGFLRDIGATEWMRQGHDAYSHNANGRCPYCGGDLPADFEQTFIASFDNRYQENLRLLDEFLARYKKSANELFVPLQTTPVELYPQIDLKPYADKLAVLKAAIQANIETIKSKAENPASAVALTDIQPILEDLAEIINGFNSLIDANNAIVAAGPTKRTECTDAVFSLLAFMLKDVIATYRKSDGDMQAELDALDAEIKAHNATLDEIKTQLKTLRGKTVETDTAKDSIAHTDRACIDVCQHGGGQLEFFFIVIAISIFESALGFALNQNDLTKLRSLVSAQLKEVIFQDAANDIHQRDCGLYFFILIPKSSIRIFNWVYIYPFSRRIRINIITQLNRGFCADLANQIK